MVVKILDFGPAKAGDSDKFGVSLEHVAGMESREGGDC